MGFKVTSAYTADTKIYPGMIITYKVSPLLGIQLNWMTEITQVKEGEYFVDEQRSGPYKIWHHEHHFKEINGGVLMTDILSYAVPFWLLGQVANKLFVHAEVQKIFDYRVKAVNELFGVYKDRGEYL